jgi:two-component system sensor histidine kinase VanS
MKKRGIFAKVFVYTTLFSALLVGAATALLLQQLLPYRAQLRVLSIVGSYNDAFSRAQGENEPGALRIFDRSQSFPFYIVDRSGRVVYKTRDADKFAIPLNDNSKSTIMIRLDREYNLHAFTKDVFAGNYGKWIAQAVFTAAAMFAACIAGSLFFARRFTKPITSLADCTHKMANLEEIAPMPERGDELGALARDIHSMYAKLKNEIRREAELAETQRYFFAAASHELKTPIAAASALIEGMLANVGDYKDHPKYLRACLKLADAQDKIVSEILETVHLTDGKIVPVAEILNLGRVVADVLPEMRVLAGANALRVIAEIPEETAVLADPRMLKRALSNVILNAVQNTPDGGEVRVWSEIIADKRRLCVLNAGAGIDEALLSRLFDPFYRIDKARSRKDGRSGLGLTIVRKTLEAMGVTFALENTAAGVLFRMDLPGA